MLLSVIFLLALGSAFYVQVPGAGGVNIAESSAVFQWNEVARAQAMQQRKLLILEFKLNQVLSKLLHLTQSKDEKQERLERMLKQLKQNVQILVRSWQRLEAGKAARLKGPKEQMSTMSLQTTTVPATVDWLQPAKQDCSELDEQERIDGVYKFLEPELNEIDRDLNERYCAFATEGPAWTVVQKRSDPPIENFNRTWNEYRTGFGHLSHDFWLGNEFIHKIIYRDDDYTLRVELEDLQGITAWAEYDLFRLDSESYNYQLLIGKFNESSTAVDALSSHNLMDFKTHDLSIPCNGGWWFNDQHCLVGESNLNAPSILWGNRHNNNIEYSLRISRILIRRRFNDNFNDEFTDL